MLNLTSVLDPNYKLAYVEEKWDNAYVERGKGMLNDVASTTSDWRCCMSYVLLLV